MAHLYALLKVGARMFTVIHVKSGYNVMQIALPIQLIRIFINATLSVSVGGVAFASTFSLYSKEQNRNCVGRCLPALYRHPYLPEPALERDFCFRGWNGKAPWRFSLELHRSF